MKRGLNSKLVFLLKKIKKAPYLASLLSGQADQVAVTYRQFIFPTLPKQFENFKITFLSDLHRGPTTSSEFLERVIAITNSLDSDLIALGGDYVFKYPAYINSVAKILSKLKAPFGVFAVFGNHDYWNNIVEMRNAFQRVGIIDLTNTGKWIQKQEDRIRIAGVGDLWEDQQDLEAALGDSTNDDFVILLSHNPDFAPEVDTEKVKLILSGHTHGGQVNFPFIGPLFTNSKYGRKYSQGEIKTNKSILYISRGIGTVEVPIRINCKPEILHLTLQSA